MAAVLVACGAVALVTSSVANFRRVSLRCIDGDLVAHRGRPLPFGEELMDQERYPPIAVEDEHCLDVTLGSVRELERRYVDWTVSRVDEAMIAADPDALESAEAWMERVSSERSNEQLRERRRSILVELVERDLREADASLERARSRLQEAKDAGVDDEVLRALQDRLDALTGGPQEPPKAPAVPPKKQPEPTRGPSPRAL